MHNDAIKSDFHGIADSCREAWKSHIYGKRIRDCLFQEAFI